MKRISRILLLGLAGILILSGAVLAEQGKGKNRPNGLTVKLHPTLMAVARFKTDTLQAHSIGQSHIDVAWRWRMAQTHTKVYKTFSNAVENMGRHPGFIYSQSQPLLYEWMMQDHPELFEQIKEMEKQGRWEITGGMWVESDCNMPEGESFARQFLLGQRFYLEHFGHGAKILWLPDTFGYNRNLPQLSARAGIKYLWAKKLTTNFDTAFPFHNFIWRSPDGSSILVNDWISIGYPEFYPYRELINIDGYHYLFKYTNYELKPEADRVFNYQVPAEVIRTALSREFINQIPIYYGVGDGGMGPQEREIVNQERLAQKGYTRFSSAAELFQDLEKFRGRLPVWDDEMYLERHRGVQTTQAWLKRANRLSENLLRSAEALSSVANLFGTAYPAQKIRDAWKILCTNQFHDILPGSSIPEVYEDAKKDFALLESDARAVINDGLKQVARLATVKKMEGADPVLVFNSLGWERPGLVKMETGAGKNYSVSDKDGKALASQIVSISGKNYLWFRANPVPSVGYSVYYLRPAAGSEPLISGQLNISDSGDKIVMENEYLKVSVCKKQGWIVSIIDRASGKELIDGSANKLLAFFDRHQQHRAWNIDPDYYKKPIEIPAASEVKISASGPLLVEAVARRELKNNNKVTTFEQKVRLVRGDPLLYLDLDSDFQIENSLVKLEFNTTLDGNTVAADGPYLTIERPTHPQTIAAKARWEMANQKWIDLSDGKHGLALLNNGKYGFSLTENGKGFCQTLIKGAEYPASNPDSENVAHYKSNQLPYTDQGIHHIELALLVHQGGWRQAKLYQQGYNFNLPLEAIKTEPHSGELPDQASFVSLDSESAYLGIIKRAEDDDDLVVRLIEAEGKKGLATIKLGQGIKILSAAETDLIELNPKPISTAGSSLSLELEPYQIRTIKLKVKK